MAEEQGRTKGGRRNVEASLLLSANERANSKEQGSNVREKQEDLLKAYAIENSIWFTEDSFSDNDFIDEGTESKVYTSPKDKYVRKTINYKRYSKTPQEFLDNRISLHNYLFPETNYELIGFTEVEDFTGKKTFAFVVEQPFIEGSHVDLYLMKKI